MAKNKIIFQFGLDFMKPFFELKSFYERGSLLWPPPPDCLEIVKYS